MIVSSRLEQLDRTRYGECRLTVGGQRRMTYGNFVAIMIQFVPIGGLHGVSVPAYVFVRQSRCLQWYSFSPPHR